ncbi:MULTISPECIES: ferritin [unclassified Knoellia]|uniref:ferritin n=1 Tax=Knoellia altitudinis TaxID=3404795 RepID=UPI00362233F7
MFTSPTTSFVTLLREQVRHEFTASQQYIAIAVWFDDLDLPRLAERFYAQSVEERNHAMMMVRYMLDRDWDVEIPGVDPVRNSFDRPAEPIALAFEQEKTVTEQCEALFRAARAEGDVLSEQFMLWFLKEQVEEVSSMKTLLTITERADDDWFQVEEHLAREPQVEPDDSSAPDVAGGLL